VKLEPLASVAAAREEWGGLAASSGNVFATPEWHELWLARHDGEPRLQALRDKEGRLRSVLPLVLERIGPLRVLRFSGHGPGDENGPVCATEYRTAAVEALRGLLAGGGYDVFAGEQLPAWAAVGRVLSREGSPVVRIDGRSWDDLLAARSSNFREQVRRRERKLAREHDLRFRLSDAARLEADLGTLFRLHRARWGGGDTSFGAREQFHRAFAALAQERGGLRLWLLELDGEPAAAWLGFRYGDADSYYQLGRDPSWDRASVGFVLLAHTIREAAADGRAEYRFLRGGESYKDRFADEDPGLVTVGSGRGPAGRAALSAAVAARRARRLLARARRPS
jgi:CelD/BcsL family acetyltransferase involved in cellulose biosynthesis